MYLQILAKRRCYFTVDNLLLVTDSIHYGRQAKVYLEPGRTSTMELSCEDI